MAITDRIFEALGLVTEERLSTERWQSYKSGFKEAVELSGEDEPASGDIAKYGYTRVGTSGRDYAKIPHDKMLNVVWALWNSNPMAKRALNIKRDYIIGRNARPQANDDDLQEILDAFWEDNKLSRRIRQFVRQLYRDGDQCYPAFTRRSDGRVRLGFIDPKNVKRVISHPENAMEMWAVVVEGDFNPTDDWRQARGERVYRIVRKYDASGKRLDGGGNGDPDPEGGDSEFAGRWVTEKQARLEPWEAKLLQAYGLQHYSGCCFYERVNADSNESRGRSDLQQEADWLDQHDETLFGLAEREQTAGYFSFDVTLEGADKERVRERAVELRQSPPKKGSVNVHNEKETWEMHAPDLKQAGSIDTATALSRFILGGLGLPEHWYAKGDETNRATAEAQGAPTWKSLEADQGTVRSLIVWMLEFVRDQAIIGGKYRPGEDADTSVDVALPEMTAKDVKAIITAAQPFASALMIAQQQGWITEELAVEAWSRVMAEMGIEYAPQDVTGEVAVETLEQAMEDAAKRQAGWMKRLEGILANA